MSDIKIANATYNDVTQVDLITSTGAVASFYEAVGSQTVIENGTYDVKKLAEIVVNVAGGGGGLEYDTGSITFESRQTANVSIATLKQIPRAFYIRTDESLRYAGQISATGLFAENWFTGAALTGTSYTLNLVRYATTSSVTSLSQAATRKTYQSSNTRYVKIDSSGNVTLVCSTSYVAIGTYYWIAIY